MSIQSWWPGLRPSTQDWLLANNGAAVPESMLAEIQAAGGPSPTDPWWVPQDPSGLAMPDEAVDWVEELANEEPLGG
jgi:hypothetical protein